MKLYSKTLSGLSLAMIFALSAQANATPVDQEAKPILILNEAIANKGIIKGEYPLLKVNHLELVPELKGIKFNFHELLKAQAYIVNEGYDSVADVKNYPLFSYSYFASRSMDQKLAKLTGAEHDQYMVTLDQAFKQAPVLAYYEYMTTGKAPEQKDMYSLVQYQNEKYGNLRLTELPVVLNGQKNDLFMLNLLGRVILPVDSVLTYKWHKDLSKNNTAPFKTDKETTFGDLFTANRTQHAKIMLAVKSVDAESQQPIEIAASTLLKQQRQEQTEAAASN